MAAPLKAGIAPELDLADGFTLQFTALSPTTGAVNTSVIVSNANLTVERVQGEDLSNLLEPVDPLFVPLPASELE